MKSRVWDIEEKEWNPDRHAVLPDGSLMFDCADREWQTPGDPERFQLSISTGVKAENDQFIFEGDIISAEFLAPEEAWDEIGIVYYCEESASFKVCNSFGECDGFEDWQDATIVGNVWETPEALNEHQLSKVK